MNKEINIQTHFTIFGLPCCGWGWTFKVKKGDAHFYTKITPEQVQFLCNLGVFSSGDYGLLLQRGFLTSKPRPVTV